MKTLMNAELVQSGSQSYTVVMVQSQSNRDKSYRVDVTNQRCDCGAWKFQKAVDGKRRPCKHLKSLGFGQMH